MDNERNIHLAHNGLQPSTSNCHVIEVSDSEESTFRCVADLTSSSTIGKIDSIERLVNVWDEMSEQSRSFSSSFMISQVRLLKKRVREVAYQTDTQNQAEKSINGSVDDVVSEGQPLRKQQLMKRSTTTINQDIDLEHEKERLLKRMSQMRRLALIFQSLDRTHSLLRTELHELLEEAQREHIQGPAKIDW